MLLKPFRFLNYPLIHFVVISFALLGGLYLLLGWSSFSEDDAHILEVAARYGWFEVYYKPEIYQQLSAAHYTPVALSIYKFLWIFTGLNPSSFLVFQLLCFGVVSALCAQLCFKITKDYWASIFVVVLMFSSEAILTLISRFYTTHYLVGGIFSLIAFLLYFGEWEWEWERERETQWVRLLFVAIALFLSLQSKEVYIISALVLMLYALKKRDLYALGAFVLTVALHIALRWHVIGLSQDGRSGDGYAVEILGVNGAQWGAFFLWYLNAKFLIIVFAVIAMVLDPKKFLSFFAVALLFSLPALGAVHGIIYSDQHADRIFFAFDCALIVAICVVLFNKASEHVKVGVIVCAFFVSLFLQYQAAQKLKAIETKKVDYIITQFVLSELGEGSSLLSLLLPLNFKQGALMNVINLMGERPVFFTLNCLQALNSASTYVLFDSEGNRIELSTLKARCKAMNASLTLHKPVQFNRGVLEWDVNVSPSYSAGILFVERAFSVATTQFSERFVRPRDNEKYQVYATDGTHWWFSETLEVLINSE
ncbi:hypothetical protein [Alkalimarinus alittae]|uniref:Glycosyltransferase RgtA/B/C/D-like domain-containing protein n=1 Tax=Alkalimarinus alittae TaxID=2961619 RepID=A0ABY6MZ80_9ALTE|nr:hypothetical protein [Alkalimarinus alittae]UZE95129.1 hypothetical protein NKI27_13770 [Alkalimarinus alittae]